MQIALPLLGRPDVGQQQTPHVRLDNPSTHQRHRRNSQPLLEDLTRERHRARRRAPHVRVMRPGGHVSDGLLAPVGPDATHRCQIRQVCAPVERVVQYDHVAIGQITPVDGRTHALRDRAQMHGHVISQSHRSSIAVADGTAVIPSLFDVRRIGAPSERGSHLLRYRQQKRSVDL